MPKLSHHELADIEASIAHTEADQEAKRAFREEKRLQKERQTKRHSREKLVAPSILFLTIFISVILWLFAQPW